MPYQPYYPGGWQPGQGGGTPISADALNHMEGQYDAVKTELASPGGDLTVHVANVVGAARVAQIDIFTSSGTWTKPEGARLVYVQIISGGGGGGGMVSVLLPASTLPDTVSVIVGAGGTGGPNGQAGGNGGDSQFWNIKSIGGQGGQAVRNGGHGGGIRLGILEFPFGPGSVGGAGANTAWSTVGRSSEYGGGGGGIGGNPSAEPVWGTSGGSSLGGGGGGGGGVSDHSSGRTPGPGGTSILAGAGGQGGGWGGNGQDGTAPGGGGGGAGGYNSATSRRGGNGARGEVRVYTFF